MSNSPETSSQTATQQNFRETYEMLLDNFGQRGIRVVCLGSVAASSYLGTELDFARKSRDFSLSIPDVDLLVPRDDLAYAREYRDKLARSSFPLRVGLAVPSQAIDWRPEEDESFLTSGRQALALDSEVLRPVELTFLGGRSVSVDSKALARTYGVMAGRLRKKDYKTVRDLEAYAEDNSNITDDKLLPFEHHKQHERSDIYMQAIYGTKKVHDMLPKSLQSRLGISIITTAAKLGLR